MCVFVSVLIFVLLKCPCGLPKRTHVQLGIPARKPANMCIRMGKALSLAKFPHCAREDSPLDVALRAGNLSRVSPELQLCNERPLSVKSTLHCR